MAGPARAQSMSQSMGVDRFAPRGATGRPSPPMPGSGPPATAGSWELAVPDGGGSSPPLRPQPARPRAATSAPIAAILSRLRPDDGINRQPSRSEGILSDRTEAATAWRPVPCRQEYSLTLLAEQLEPSVGFPPHVLWRRSAVADAALHRIVDREHGEHILADALLDRLHGGERQPVQRN